MSEVVEVLREMLNSDFCFEDKWEINAVRIKSLREALLTLEEKERYRVFVADLQERIWLHEAREPSSYILSDLRIFFKQRLKELKLNEVIEK